MEGREGSSGYTVVYLGLCDLPFFLLCFFSGDFSCFYVFQDFVIRAYVRPWTDILYRLQMFPKAIEPALAEAAPRQG